MNNNASAVDALEREIQTENLELTHKEAELGRKKTELLQAEAEVKRLQSDVQKLETDVNGLKLRKAEKEREIAKIQQELQASMKSEKKKTSFF